MINELFINALTKAAYEDNIQDIHEDALVFIEEEGEESIIAKGKTYTTVPSNGVEGRALIYKNNKPQWLDILIDALDLMFNNASYDEDARRIRFYHNDVEVASIDATPFIVDNFVDSVVVEDGHVVIKFNSADKSDIKVPITDIFNAENYYTKELSDAKYVKKSGDTMTGTLKISCGTDAKIVLDNTDNETNYSTISFRQNGTEFAFLGIQYIGKTALKWTGDGGIVTRIFTSEAPQGISPFNVSSTTKVSNLNADMVDGYHSTDLFRTLDKITENGKEPQRESGIQLYEYALPDGMTGYNIGELISFKGNHRYINFWVPDFATSPVRNEGLFFRSYLLTDSADNIKTFWKQIAFTDSTVATANSVRTEKIPTGGRHLNWFAGEILIGTADGNAYKGSSNNLKLWSFPEEGTTHTDTYADIMNLRMGFSDNYFADLHFDPNIQEIYYRIVQNNKAYDWKKIAFTDSTVANATNLNGHNSDWYLTHNKSFNPYIVNAVNLGDANTKASGGGIICNYAAFGDWINAPTGLGYGCVLEISGNDSGDSGNNNPIKLAGQLAWDSNHNSETPTRNLWWRSRNSTGWGNDWRQIAFTDSTVAAANKLAKTVQIWGQIFDGSNSINGQLTVQGGSNRILKIDGPQLNAISPTGGWAFGYTVLRTDRITPLGSAFGVYGGENVIERYYYGGLDHNSAAMYILPDGKVGVGVTSPKTKLDVNGSLTVRANLTVGGTIEVTGRVVAPKSINKPTWSGNLTFDAEREDVCIIKLSGNVSSMTFSKFPPVGQDVTAIMYSSDNTERTVVIANNDIYRTPTGEDIELTVPANGYVEVNFLYDGTNVWIRGV